MNMLDGMLLYVALGLVAAMVGVWWVRRQAGVEEPLAAGADGVWEAMILARALVMAAEQLWLTGDLYKDERFDYVWAQMKARYPALDEKTLQATIEAAVFWMKVLVRKQADPLDDE
jgi:hypothetical protein